MKPALESIDAYIASFPPEVKKALSQVRETIRKAAPKAEETISYAMPTFKYKGPLAYFAGYKSHIGFYALPSGHAQFKDELSKYKTGKGSVQFPLSQPMPLKLITKIIKFRLRENSEREKTKLSKKSKT